MSHRGHIELDRAVDSITVGRRHRRDLGDLTDLIESIRQLGLLQPITVSAEGLLICGARRLEAAKRLGLRQVNVWVRSGISDQLHLLLAEQHENTLAKPFNPIEAAALYRELKALIAEDAARRQEASWFGYDGDPYGGADSAPPADRKSRARAAQLVTGRKSYSMLEQVNELEELLSNPNTPEEIREVATQALKDIADEGKVNGHYQAVKRAQAGTRQDTDLEEMARDALTRIHTQPHPSDERAVQARGPRRLGTRAFLLMWADLRGWTDHYDPVEIGPALSDEQWANFEATVAATVTFAREAHAARMG